jgi:hypothetical protein
MADEKKSFPNLLSFLAALDNLLMEKAGDAAFRELFYEPLDGMKLYVLKNKRAIFRGFQGSQEFPRDAPDGKEFLFSGHVSLSFKKIDGKWYLLTFF